LKGIHPAVQDELLACAKDFYRFCNWLKIVDKDGNLITLTPNFCQEKWLEQTDDGVWTYVLKARKEGLSTIIAAKFFWKAFFRPHHSVLVVSEIDTTAQGLFGIYKRFYEHLPDAFRKAVPTVKFSLTEMEFTHGGKVSCKSAQSSFRGDTRGSIHFSEFAFYKHIQSTINAAGSVAGDGAEVVMETTANGMNEAHGYWKGDNAYKKIFIPWSIDADNRRKKFPKINMPKTMKEKLDRYVEHHGLDEQQKNWIAEVLFTKCGGSWRALMQEYPNSPIEAFVSSGDPVFPYAYENIPTDDHIKYGRVEYEEHKRFRVYTMGVDPATGTASEEGDYSAYCVMDVTEKDKPKIVCTYYDRIPLTQFKRLVHKEAKNYDVLVVPEVNAHGLVILDWLVEKKFVQLYVREQFDKVAKQWRQMHGWMTTAQSRPILIEEFRELIAKKTIELTVEFRLMREMNTFIYNDVGRPEHDKGMHDDMIFAAALAWMGRSQTKRLRMKKEDTYVHTLQEKFEYESQLGKECNTDLKHKQRRAIRNIKSAVPGRKRYSKRR
jgi:hypothetical protein